MREIRIEFRVDHAEKKELNKISRKYGFTTADYIRYKLFNTNCDTEEANERYVSPEESKNNLITLSVIYKVYYLLTRILEKQGADGEELQNITDRSLEYARTQRLKYGYKIIKFEE
jgi:hypothetical protein